MAEYHVAYMCVYKETVEAESPEEAADIVAENCPYMMVQRLWVINGDTGEEWEV